MNQRRVDMDFREIRAAFLEFFKRHGHEVVESSSLIPSEDPSLLFTNAGMVQFKRLFLGEERRSYKRAATCQKCMRAGGKHNDLDNVGFTHRHHTFFEMLGNFSFGDYFKKEAILWAWELLTEVYGLDPNDLYVSVYEEDDEAFSIWEKEVGIPDSKIVRLGKESNFWTMGDTGPCGPCSEIYQDLGPEMGCENPHCAPGCDCDRYLEVWNLVFTQFDRSADGSLRPLSKPNIDTGMGLERICSVVQGKRSNFETDLFIPIIQRIEDLSGKGYGKEKRQDVSFRVIADHSRAVVFLVAEGIVPSNEGRGYVLRRIIRRAIRFGLNLGLKEGFMWPVAEKVIEIMGPDYKEVLKARNAIKGVILNEEKRFHYTLEQGMKALNEYIEEMREKGLKEIPGQWAFKLYDTYGLSLDIVQDVAKEEGLGIDLMGYKAAMEVQRTRSQEAWKTDHTFQVPSHLKDLVSEGHVTTFVGYETLFQDTEILKIYVDGNEVEEVTEGKEAEIILAKSPFYGEGGGQVGDKGLISSEAGTFLVENTKKYGQGLIVHGGRVEKGRLRVSETVTAEVFEAERLAVMRHHTSTHLLHAALRNILGEHVKQAGSLVAPNRLRFDFTHFQQVPKELLKEIEEFVNAAIQKNLPVRTSIMKKAEAIEAGAIAIFEEKYGDVVRLVEIEGVSKELCGGTHVAYTGQIGLFKIVSETGIASNVRRIEALSGMAALKYIHTQEDVLRTVAEAMKVGWEDLPNRLEVLLREQKEAQREIERLKQKLLAQRSAEILSGLREVKGVKVVADIIEADSPKALREAGDRLKEKIGSGVIILAAVADQKAMLICSVTKDLTERIKAAPLAKELSRMLGGSGGGRADMAQGGGPHTERLNEVIQKAYSLVDQLLG